MSDITDDEKAIARRLRPAQRRLLLAMSERRPKKWRAIYRHAKVRHWDQLPFSLAEPTLTGYEVLTDLGRRVRASLRARAAA